MKNVFKKKQNFISPDNYYEIGNHLEGQGSNFCLLAQA